MLQHLLITDYTCLSGQTSTINLTFEVFGQPLHSAPVVLINHALTGNSNVAGTNGWWKTLVGPEKTIDTEKYTVLCFNIPGNGYQHYGSVEITQFTVQDVAKIFRLGLEKLGIQKLHTIIGGSIGGAIGWEMLAQNPKITERLIPIATAHKTSDWLNAQCLIQNFLLDLPENALEKARMHAMLCYRTPESINQRFQNEKQDQEKLKSQEWLEHHGDALKNRFQKEAYRNMNHLLTSIQTNLELLKNTDAEIHLIAVDSDLFFSAIEIKNTYQKLKKEIKNISYNEIKSVHGHDAFLIEYEQLNQILNPILNYHEQQYHYNLQEQSTY